ncbi:glycoside hydrolase superfamily [Linnemannia elongata]|nr:glycoside hydrolase superfamily [Linnemannia elongata]
MRISLLALAATAIAVASAAPAPVKRAAKPNVVLGYWVPWGDVPVASLDMTKYTHINYGFGVTAKRNAKVTDIFFDRYYDGNNIKALVKRGNEYGVPILMSIGGWTGSQTLSTIAADAGLRKTFINNALVFVRNNTLPDYADTPDGWNMHGIDLDWEYPGRPGAICNTVSPNDSANYLVLLRELRAQLDLEFPNNRKLLTAAVRVQPFDGTDGKPLADVSAFAAYFDWVSIMAYDIMGSWSATTGPNAPFNNGPVGKADQFSFTQGIAAWSGAGFPLSKIVVGTAFYGRSVTTTVNMNTQNPISMYVNKTNVTPKGGPADRNDINFFCNEGSVYSGMWKWKEIRGNILTGGVTTPHHRLDPLLGRCHPNPLVVRNWCQHLHLLR